MVEWWLAIAVQIIVFGFVPLIIGMMLVDRLWLRAK